MCVEGYRESCHVKGGFFCHSGNFCLEEVGLAQDWGDGNAMLSGNMTRNVTEMIMAFLPILRFS